MSPGRFTHRGVNASGSCSGERGNVLTVGTYCYVAAARGASAPAEGGEGRGILWRPPDYSLLFVSNARTAQIPGRILMLDNDSQDAEHAKVR